MPREITGKQERNLVRPMLWGLMVLLLAIQCGIFIAGLGHDVLPGLQERLVRAAAKPLLDAAFAQQDTGIGGLTLSDLIYGLIKLEDKPGLGLSRAQIRKIMPALKAVSDASKTFQETEDKMKTILTQKQMDYIGEKLKDDAAVREIYMNMPARPGEDPIVLKVVEILNGKQK